MTIGEFEYIIKSTKTQLEYYLDNDIYNQEKSRGKETCVKGIGIVFDNINKISIWLENYKNKLVENIEIGRSLK